MPQCPICQASVTLHSVWGLVSLDRRGCPEKTIGITCPGCLTKLRVSTVSSNVALAAILIGSMAFCFALMSMYPRQIAIAAIAIIPLIATVLCTARIAQRFATLVPLKAGEVVEIPVEEFRDQLAADAAEFREFEAHLSSAGATKSWVCLKCHETNPGGFETCWKCTSDDTTVA